MIDGLWTAEFGSSTGEFGGGVVVLQGDRVLGGDGGHYYDGNFSLAGSTFQATIKIRPFIQNYLSVFKIVNKDFTLHLSGSLVNERELRAQGHANELPGLTFGVKLFKRS